MAGMRDWALSYAQGGLAVFPLEVRGKMPLISKEKGGKGFMDATTDTQQILGWWKREPAANIGIATGRPSRNILVIDLDYHPERCIDGRETLEEWESDHGKLPDTWTATSGTGGMHLYYRGDGSERCSIDNAHKTGVDIRANGGYVVAPPSVHPDGGRYEWDLAPNEISLASANDLVHEFIKFIQGDDREEQKLHLPEVIGRGSRNYTLFRAACSMQSTGFPDEVIDVAIQKLNLVSCQPPISDSEVKKILSSAKNNEKGGGMDRWKKSAELMKQELLQDLRDHMNER